MSESESTHAFFQQGLLKYPAALDAVDLFETTMKEHLIRALTEKDDWKKFVPAVDEAGHRVQPTAGTIGAASRWIYASLEGAKQGEERKVVSLGICWRPPKLKTATVAYAVYQTNNRVVSIDARGARDARIVVGAIDRSERRPYLVVGPDFDAERDFALLLDALDAGLPEKGAGVSGGGAG